MVPLGTKLQNELLLELARNLRQERLLIGSERQNLQSLNQKVCVSSTVSFYLALCHTISICNILSHDISVLYSVIVLALVYFQILIATVCRLLLFELFSSPMLKFLH